VSEPSFLEGTLLSEGGRNQEGQHEEYKEYLLKQIEEKKKRKEEESKKKWEEEQKEEERVHRELKELQEKYLKEEGLANQEGGE